MKTRWIIASVVILIIITGLYFFMVQRKYTLPTYFNYSKMEQLPLNRLESTYEMSESSLKKWDNLMFELVKSHKLGDAPASRIYAYLYTAQRDAAFLSYNNKHRFKGSLDPVSAEVLCLFFTDKCEKIKFNLKTDDYSTQLARLILDKVTKRMELDKKQQRLSQQQRGDNYWVGDKPYFGQEVGSWKTWVITSPDKFLPPSPETIVWSAELKQTESALEHINPTQTKAVVFWAGNPSTITPPGIWLKFANDYMESNKVDFPETVYTRSVLAMGIADVVISIFHAKYTYWIKRPYMLNPQLHTVMPTPNHPSYPAGHSGISATAAEILTHYFPQHKKIWWEKANEASLSRVWGGIHFPIDAKEGIILGTNVGKDIIKVNPTLSLGKE